MANKDQTIKAKVTASLANELAALAEKNCQSVSAEIRRAVIDYIARCKAAENSVEGMTSRV